MKSQHLFPIIAAFINLLLCGPSLAAYNVVEVPLQVNDIIYDPVRGTIYASIPGSAGPNGNTITKIDPVTGATGPSIFVGSEPGELAISDDAQFLYVSLDGAASVRRVDLATFTADIQFSLGTSPIYGPLYAEDIEVQPGNAGTVAVSLIRSGVSPRHGGVAIYDDGIQRPNITPDHTGSNRIEFSSVPSTLYGYNNETTEFGFREMLVDMNGVTVLDVSQDFISGFGVDIEYQDGRVYSTTGVVLEPGTPTILGTYAVGFVQSVVPDAVANRTYFLSSNGSIDVFNLTDFTFVENIDVVEAIGTSDNLIHTGNSNLAFSTDSSQVLLLTTEATPQAFMKISPRSGMFLSTQQYDLGITVKTGGAAISAITHALLNSVDISSALTACIIPGRIGPGLLTLRCPGFSSLLPPATSRRAYTFDLAIELSDGTIVSEAATWVILPTVEMP